MIFRVLFLVFFSSMGLCQNVLYGLSLEQGTQVLAFITPNCEPCKFLKAISGLPLIFVGRQDNQEYAPYVKDPGDILARSFRIQQAPTVIVISSGSEVKRFVPPNLLDARLLNLALQAAQVGLITPAYATQIKLGEMAPAPYNDYTGLLVFGREGCQFCEQEKNAWVAMCQNKVSVRLVYSEGKWPEACPGEVNVDLFQKFGIPGTPTHIYLEAGRVVWIDVGYRTDLVELVQALSTPSYRCLYNDKMQKQQYPVQLQREERSSLLQLCKKGTVEVRVYKRARALLLAHEGLKDQEIAQQVGLSRITLVNLRRHFQQERIQCIYDRPRSGRKPRLELGRVLELQILSIPKRVTTLFFISARIANGPVRPTDSPC